MFWRFNEEIGEKKSPDVKECHRKSSKILKADGNNAVKFFFLHYLCCEKINKRVCASA
jgi:hypothetical protein